MFPKVGEKKTNSLFGLLNYQAIRSLVLYLLFIYYFFLQLKQYTEIPLSKTCFCPVLCLLLDNDSFVAQAAGTSRCHLEDV